MEALWKPKIRAKRWYFLVVSILCIVVALLISLDVVFGFCAIFLALLIIREIGKGNWKTSSEDYSFKESLKVLNSTECQRGTYKIARPHILCFSPQKKYERNMLKFASTMSRNYGSIIRGKVLIGDPSQKFADAITMRRRYESLARRKNLNIFEEIGIGTSFRSALQQLMLNTGCGIYRVTDLMIPVSKSILKVKEEIQTDSTTSTSELLTNTSGTYKMFNNASSGKQGDTSYFARNYTRMEGSQVAQNPEFYMSELGTTETNVTPTDYLQAILDSMRMKIGVSIVLNMDMLYSGFGGEKTYVKSRGKKLDTLNGPFIDVYMLTDDIGNLMLPMLLSLEGSRRYTLRIYIGLYGSKLDNFVKEVNRLLKSEKTNFVIEAIWPKALQINRHGDSANAMKLNSLNGSRRRERGTLANYYDFSDSIDDQNGDDDDYLYEIDQEKHHREVKPYGTKEYPMVPIEDAVKFKRGVRNIMMEDAIDFHVNKGANALSGSNALGTAISPGRNLGSIGGTEGDRPISDHWNEKTLYMEQLGNVIKTVSFNADFVFVDLPYPDILVPADVYMNWVFKLGGQDKVPVILSRSYDSYRIKQF